MAIFNILKVCNVNRIGNPFREGSTPTTETKSHTDDTPTQTNKTSLVCVTTDG